MAHSNRAGPSGICRQFCAKASELIGPNIRTASAIIRNIIDLLNAKSTEDIQSQPRGEGKWLPASGPWSFCVSIPHGRNLWLTPIEVGPDIGAATTATLTDEARLEI